MKNNVIDVGALRSTLILKLLREYFIRKPLSEVCSCNNLLLKGSNHFSKNVHCGSYILYVNAGQWLAYIMTAFTIFSVLPGLSSFHHSTYDIKTSVPDKEPAIQKSDALDPLHWALDYVPDHIKINGFTFKQQVLRSARVGQSVAHKVKNTGP